MEQTDKPTYLYAIVPDLRDETLGPIGLFGSEVRTIKDGNMFAVISELPSSDELRPERQHLAAHQAVVNRVLADSSVVLPVSFGTIADSPEGVRHLLEEYGSELSQKMEKVKGKAQMNVRLTYPKEKPNLFEFLVGERHPEVQQLMKTMFAGGRQPSRDERIDLGQKLDTVLSEARDDAAQKMEEALASVCEGQKRNAPRSEREIVRLACLVDKEKTDEFHEALENAAKNFPNVFVLEESGPFPPYDFTELHLTV